MFLAMFARLKTEFSEADITDWEKYWEYVSYMTITGMADDVDDAVIKSMILAGLKPPTELTRALAFTLKTPLAVQWLENYGAVEVAGIDVTTKGYLNTVITDAMDSGQSYAKTAREIKNRFNEFAIGQPQKHIRSRAELIAVTETGNAYEEASMIQSQSLQNAGLPMEKSWLTSRDDRVSDGCMENEDAGWIPLDDAFPSGDMRPLRFPGCRCALLTRMMKEGRGYPVQQDSVFSHTGYDREEATQKANSIFASKKGKLYDDYYAVDADDRHLGASPKEGAILKDTVVSRIAEDTGLDYNRVNMTVKNWAYTSNDADTDALNIQKIASDMFDGKLSDWQKGKMQDQISKAGGKSWKDVKRGFTDDEIKSVLKSMNKNTKNVLKDLGYEPDSLIPIYRGVQEELGELGDKVLVKGNALESWSLSEDVATEFAEGTGTVLYKEVPAKDVLGTFLSGFGCTDEDELVIKNVGDYIAEIISG